MKLRECVGCGGLVLELRGQFAVLDSFFVDDDVPPLESAGAWHLRCLAESPFGESWFLAKHRNYVSVRRYEDVATFASWCVLRNRNTKETLALARTGATLGLSFSGKRPRQLPGGGVYTVSEDLNLELPDLDAIKAIQDALRASGTFPIAALFEILGISERVVHSEALEGGLLRYESDMPAPWQRDFVCGRAEYGVFVPVELEPYVQRVR